MLIAIIILVLIVGALVVYAHVHQVSVATEIQDDLDFLHDRFTDIQESIGKALAPTK